MTAITIDPGSSGAGSFVITAPSTANTNTLTLPDSTGNLVSTGDVGVVTAAMLAPGTSGTGPLFQASLTSNQSTGGGASAFVLRFNNVIYDTNSGFDTSAYSFTPNQAGYYQVNLVTCCLVSFTQSTFISYIYKNGSPFRTGPSVTATTSASNGSFSCIVYMNGTTDYIQAYAQVSNAASVQAASSLFSAGLIRGT